MADSTPTKRGQLRIWIDRIVIFGPAIARMSSAASAMNGGYCASSCASVQVRPARIVG